VCACAVLVPEEKGGLLIGTVIPFKLMVNPKDYIIQKIVILFFNNNYLTKFVAFNRLL
jgi:hypothetical protein